MIFNLVKKYSILFIIVILAFFTLQPLFQSGFFSMHDDEQIGRLYELDQSIKQGHFPVRITQNLGFGYGYALFNFYPPFVYYIAELFVLAGFGYIGSIKILIALGFLLSGVAMYIFCREYFNKWGSLVSATAYMYAPYHAVDVYVRGALPEFWTFVFIPVLFFLYKKIADQLSFKYTILAGVMYGFLILTHNLVAMMSGFILGIYILYLFVTVSSKKKYILQLLLSGVIGLGLSAFFWLPSFFERNTTMIELLTKELADYNQHYVYLRQLWNSPWGYGGSLYGLEDGLSFQIGKMNILGSIFSIFIAMIFYYRKNTKYKIILLFNAILGFAVIMCTFYSDFLWDRIKLLSYIQFPWRFLLFCSFASSFLLGITTEIFKSEKLRVLYTVLLLILVIVGYKDFFQPREYYRQVSDKNYTDLDVIKWKTSYMAFEYVPKGVRTEVVPGNITKIAITPDKVASSSYTVLKGDIVVKEVSIRPQIKEFNIEGKGGTLRINQFAYPGWKVYIDNKEVSYTFENDYKLIDVRVPSGSHSLKAYFSDTPIRKAGNIISLTTIMGIILYIMRTQIQINVNRKMYGKTKSKKNS